VYERKLLREQAEEAKLNGDVKAEDRFVGAAYRKQLEERERYEAALKAEAEAEAAADVTKKGMTGFYQNLLTKNIAFGGDIENATSSFTVGSREAGILGGDAPAETARAKQAEAERPRGDREPREGEEAQEEAPPSDAPGAGEAKRPAESEAPASGGEQSAEQRVSAPIRGSPPPQPRQPPVPDAKDEEEDAEAKAKAKADRIAAARERALLRRKKKEDG